MVSVRHADKFSSYLRQIVDEFFVVLLSLFALGWSCLKKFVLFSNGLVDFCQLKFNDWLTETMKSLFFYFFVSTFFDFQCITKFIFEFFVLNEQRIEPEKCLCLWAQTKRKRISILEWNVKGKMLVKRQVDDLAHWLPVECFSFFTDQRTTRLLRIDESRLVSVLNKDELTFLVDASIDFDEFVRFVEFLVRRNAELHWSEDRLDICRFVLCKGKWICFQSMSIYFTCVVLLSQQRFAADDVIVL